MEYKIKDSWMPPKDLWLILDFSNFTTKGQFNDAYNILKYLPDNDIELRVLSDFYILKYESIESIGNGVFKGPKSIPPPKIMKKPMKRGEKSRVPVQMSGMTNLFQRARDAIPHS